MRREFKNKSMVFLIYLPVSWGHENKFSEEETLVYFSICGLQCRMIAGKRISFQAASLGVGQGAARRVISAAGKKVQSCLPGAGSHFIV